MDDRSPDQIRHHYEVETELAARLKEASRVQRLTLYNEVYSELHRRVPGIHREEGLRGAEARAKSVTNLVEFLTPLLRNRRTFMELGPGDLKLSIAIAPLVAQVVAVDVTAEEAKRAALPRNVTFLLSDGINIDIDEGSVDFAFSDQVMEHLHPEDAEAQVRSIHRALTRDGVYVCITPNRLYGPHDISQYFDTVARGLHLKEYTVSEVAALFRSCGFRRVEAHTVLENNQRRQVPLPLVQATEWSLDRLPKKISRGLACSNGLRWLLRSRIVGFK